MTIAYMKLLDQSIGRNPETNVYGSRLRLGTVRSLLRSSEENGKILNGLYFPMPNRGGDVGLVYRQCFGPVTNLYFVAKDPTNPDDGWDWLYAKSGKYAAPPPQ